MLGGACVTEELWPGQRVSRASYVVSMLQPKIVSDLRLHDFGYEAVPLDPSYATFGTDGRPILFFYDTERTQAELARYSKKDADAYPGYEAVLARAAEFLRPLLLRPPPALGSKRPGDLLGLLREAGRAAGLTKRDLHELFRVMTMSVGDLLDDWFETDAVKGTIASTGVVGVWAGPRTPGTAYNLLHHDLGELNGIARRVGPREGRHGRDQPGARAERRGARRDGPHRRGGALDRRPRRSHHRRHPRERRGGARPACRLRRASAHHGPRPRGRRALPGRGRRRHAPLPQPRRLGEDQLRAVGAAALHR